MPTYEFQCPQCHSKLEKMTSIDCRNDNPKCQKCGEEMSRTISSFSVGGTKTAGHSSDGVSIGPAGIRIGQGARDITIQNSSFRNIPTGISMATDTKVSAHNNTFQGVKNPIEFRD